MSKPQLCYTILISGSGAQMMSAAVDRYTYHETVVITTPEGTTSEPFERTWELYKTYTNQREAIKEAARMKWRGWEVRVVLSFES